MGHSKDLFHRQHYYIIAAQFREHFVMVWHPTEGMTTTSDFDKDRTLTHNGALIELALSMARRFKEDNELFDPILFLDKCSPNPDLMPISELWED